MPPQAKAAPSGLSEILRLSGKPSLGVSGGLTLIKSAAAFTVPAFLTKNTHDGKGAGVQHFSVVQRTTSQEASHDSFYPMAGEHIRPGMVQTINKRQFTHFWVISQSISDLIRQGEQEHLDDAARAYELTYKKVENEINALAGQQFGPASSPAAADALALAALEARLPKELGTDPANWVRVLDRLLTQTQVRDTKNWHALSTDPPKTVAGKILHPVVVTSTTSVGRTPSSQVVNY
jgi:hypothetical protein